MIDSIVFNGKEQWRESGDQLEQKNNRGRGLVLSSGYNNNIIVSGGGDGNKTYQVGANKWKSHPEFFKCVAVFYTFKYRRALILNNQLIRLTILT